MSTVTSAEEEKALPDLRKLLRKFYLKVHPDLFASYPKERAANQNALKELTSFTEEWVKNTAQSTFVPKTQKKIQFFLKKRPTAVPTPGSTEKLPKETPSTLDSPPNSESESGFVAHSMTLINNGSFTEVQNQYAKLFAQVGLPTLFTVGGKSNELAEFNFMDEFLVKHKETARENVKREEEASNEVREIIFRFKHHFNVSIITDSVFYNYFNFQNLVALRQVYRALESLKETDPHVITALSGAVVGLDSASADYAVDYEQGKIFLDRDGSALEYLRPLRALKLDELRAGIENRGAAEKEVEKEFQQSQGIMDKFSKQIGVKSIQMSEESSFYADDYQMDENGSEILRYNREQETILYRKLANELREEHRNLSRPWPKGKMRQVPIEIRTLHGEEGKSSRLFSDT